MSMMGIELPRLIGILLNAYRSVDRFELATEKNEGQHNQRLEVESFELATEK
jgi:hypothetical protein